MITYAFATTYWRDAEHAEHKKEGLERWVKRVQFWLKPDKIFLTTAADPALNPVKDSVTLIESHTPQTKGYDPMSWCYYLCDLEAMLRHALTLMEWDFLIELETDWVVQDLNRHLILTQFMWKPELICCPAWMDACENSFIIWKRMGVHRFLNNRKRPNLSDTKVTMTAESELKEIFAGCWWNPWPGIPTMRQEHNIAHEQFIPDEVAKVWPIVGRPSPEVREAAERLIQ